MHRTHLLYCFGLALCGAASGCESDPPPTAYPLDGVTVFVGFDAADRFEPDLLIQILHDHLQARQKRET